MSKILLISEQEIVIDKWQPLLALDYLIEVAKQFDFELWENYALIILDASYIDDNTFELSNIKQMSTRILIFGNLWSEEKQVSVLVAGAAGYCDSAAPTSVVLKAVESILQGDIWVQRHLITKVIGSLVKLTTSPSAPAVPKNPNTALACLSTRELDVARLIRQGVNNKDIASTLFISERTVKAHLTSIFTKLNVTSRLHLGLLLKEIDK
jgi:two-component system, NarL family, nitrate/nitrite response regulator NarL